MGKIRRPKSRKPKSRRSKARRTNARRTKSSGKRRTFRKNCMKKCRRTCKQRGGGAKEERRLADIAALTQDFISLEFDDQENVFSNIVLNTKEEEAFKDEVTKVFIKLLANETSSVAEEIISKAMVNENEFTQGLDWDFITAESNKKRNEDAEKKGGVPQSYHRN